MAESISLVGHGSQSPCPLGEFYRAMREKESAEGGGRGGEVSSMGSSEGRRRKRILRREKSRFFPRIKKKESK